jgi:hypothetical protein
MKRKIIVLAIIGIIIGAGSLVTAATFTDFKNSPFFLQKSMVKNTAAVSAEKQEQKNSISSADTTKSTTPRVPYKQYQNAQQVTQQKQNVYRYQQLTGQWGYLEKPEAIGSITGSLVGKDLKAVWSDRNTPDQEMELQMVLTDTTFSGNICIRKTNQNAVNTEAIAVIPIYGTYSISDGHITAFWIQGVEQLTTNLAPHYEGWFFGVLN